MDHRPPPVGPRLAGLLALTLLVGTVNGLSRVTLPLYTASLGAEPWQVGIVGGLGYAGILLLALPMGAWIERHGSRSLFVRGAAAAAVLYLLLAGVRLPWQAVAVTGMLGLVLPLRTIPAHTEFLAMLPQLGPSRSGWNRAAAMTGMFFLGPAFAAGAIGLLGYGPVFMLGAAALVAAAALGSRVLGAAEPAAAASGATLASRIRSQLALLRGHEGLRHTMAMDFLAQVASAYFVVFGMALALQRLRMPLESAAGLVTVQGVVFVAILLAGAPLVQALGPARSWRLAFVLLAAQSLVFALAPRPAALWAASAAMGFGLGIQGLLSTNRFAELMREHGRGRIGGLASLAAPAGGVLGAIGGGVASQHFGPEAGFLALGLTFAALAAWPNRARTAR